MTDEQTSGAHAVLDAAAEHRKQDDSGCCCVCGDAWPCLVTRLAAELYALRKERRAVES